MHGKMERVSSSLDHRALGEKLAGPVRVHGNRPHRQGYGNRNP